MNDNDKLVINVYNIERALGSIKALDIEHVNTEISSISNAIDSIKRRNPDVLFKRIKNGIYRRYDDE
jgi:hypothetical protein